jgi:uncharacterized protein involved in outer membrane biogenesis
VRLNFAISGATISAPLFDLPVDLSSGTLDAGVSLTAAGHAPAALLATLAGDVRLSVRNGVLSGVELPKASGALAEAAVRAALAGGNTPFTAFAVNALVANGVLTIADSRFAAPSGSGSVTGTLDLVGSTANLGATLRPNVADPPALGLRLTGPLDSPRRALELADLTLWHTKHDAPVPPSGTPSPSQ